MKIYIAMIDDRHSDTEAEPFTNPDAAIAYARGKAIEYALHESDVDEEPIDGWLYHAQYSPEGDKVWVIEKELDAPSDVA